MKYYLLVSFCFFFSVQNIWAQGGRVSNREARILHQNSLIVSNASRKLDSLFAMSHNVTTLHVDSMSNPYYASLMGAPALYPSMLHRMFGIDDETMVPKRKDYLTSDIATLLSNADSYVVNACIQYPSIVLPCEKSQVSLLNKKTFVEEHPKVELSQRYSSNVKNREGDDILSPIEDDYGIIVRRPNFWAFKTNFSLQFTQNYVSDNWYKGGESNYSLLGTLTLQANYNNKKKVKWENKLEMRLGFRNSENDTLHFLKTSEDLFRYTGKLGLQATKRWYYTMQVIATTQFMRGFNSNDTKVYSDFMSPFTINPSIGMDYGVDWLKGRIKGSIHLAPLAFNLKYCARDDIVTRFGIEEGKNTMHDFGSEFTIDVTWKFSNDISWRTRMYGYTSYKRVLFECENTFSFRINRYLSSTLFVYPRFDDSTSREERKYWQFNEYISIGFSYSF